MAITGILQGGFTTYAIIIGGIIVLLLLWKIGITKIIFFPLWLLWKIISFPFVIFFRAMGWTISNAWEVTKYVGKHSADALSASIQEKRKIQEEEELEKQEGARLEKEKHNIQQIEQILQDPNASAQQKANALRSFCDIQNNLLNEDQRAFKNLNYKKDLKDSNKVINNIKKIFSGEIKIEKMTLDEARNLAKSAKSDPAVSRAASRITYIIERELKPIGKEILVFEKGDKEHINKLRNIHNQRGKNQKDCKKILNTVKKMLDKGAFGPGEISTFSTHTRKLRENVDSMLSFTKQSEKILADRKQLADTVLKKEKKVNDLLKKLEQAIKEYQNAVADYRRRTQAKAA